MYDLDVLKYILIRS